MAEGLTPVRRVVTGSDERGRSKVVWDGPAGNAHDYAIHKTGSGSGWTDLWVFDETPPPLAASTDDGFKPYEFPAPLMGAHWRIVEYRAPPAGYDRAKDPEVVPFHEPRKRPVGRAWDKGGTDSHSAPVHMTESVDYGFVIEGERKLILEDREILMQAGDVVVQLGNWHGWRAVSDCRMAFVMISGSFEAAAEGAVAPLPPQTPAPGVKPVRRIVTASAEDGRPVVVSDGPSPDVRLDRARPGFAATRIWVTDSMPAKIKGVQETLQLAHADSPPSRGSVCSVLTIASDTAREPYWQQTPTLDFCLVMDGELTLVLDTQEVALKRGDVVVQRGTHHAWSNRSRGTATLALVAHDARRT